MFAYFRFTIVLLLLPLLTCGQGKSFFKNFMPKDYNSQAQNWCVLQDDNGLMYFGNNVGLLIYDGENWTSLKLNNSIVRSLEKAKNGRVYYGAQGEFGYLYANANGIIKSKSLVNLLPDSLKLFGDVWKTYAYEDKIIFQTFDYVFIYENEKIKILEAENYYHFGYQRKKDFYIIDREIGLKILTQDGLKMVNGGEFFANLRIYGWINYDDYALIVTREKGIFKLTFKENASIEIMPFKTKIDDLMISGEVYCAGAMSDNNIGIGTLYSGFYLINDNGELLKNIDKDAGLKSEIINAFYEDQQKGLWLALDIGIARVEINSGFQSYSLSEGLEGIVNSVVRFNGKIYFGTTKGLFEIGEKQIKKISNFNNDVRYLFIDETLKYENLIILTEVGTFSLSKENKLTKLNDENGLFIVNRDKTKTEFLIGTMSDLSLLDYSNRTTRQLINNIPEIRRIVQDADGNIWLGTSLNGVYKIKNIDDKEPEITIYDTLKGLPSNSYNLPFTVNNKLFFGTFNGIYQYNKSEDRFQKSNDLAIGSYTDADQIYQIIEGFNNQVWLFKSNEILHEFILYNSKTKTSSFPLRRMGEFDTYQCIFPENQNVTWFGGPDGLFRYDASKPSMDNIPFKTKIRGVYGINDTLFGGYFGFEKDGKKIEKQPERLIPELIYKNNNINFEFAALSFDNEKENVYSYLLEGFDNKWSDWTPEAKKSYTNLNEGTYTFHVKSKNVYGKEGEEDTYTFTILPPWYRTGWAYLGYAIGAIALVYFITQLSVRRLKRAKIKLEAIVVNRTAEVVAEKEEVEKQKKIVEIKNKDITDSINYAQRIQQAILPLPEDFTKVFPQSFIYFQPRDIVSGDFYWFYQTKKADQNWVYIAAADCTGHGVPGAFMSMIGNTLLNEILNEKQIYETDLILNQLHLEVRAALKQDTAQNTTNDGMDIALCRINLDTLELQYAGANRALYIFKKVENEIQFVDVKPNKFPIGGYQAETIRSFTAHHIQLVKGETFYIFSDGYADQFGGASNKKFMVKRLQNELMAMQKLPMHEQRYLVQKLVMDWKGDAEQVDDILMIGVRV